MDRPRIIGSKLVHEGFIYTRSHKPKNGKTYWDCQKLRQQLCTARIVTITRDGETFISKSKPHEHAPDRELAEAEVVKFNLKQEQQQNPDRNPAQILRNVLSRTSSGIIAHLPDRRNLNKSMRQARRGCMPANPTSLEALEDVPESYQMTLTGDKFLLYDSRHEIEGRVIVFCTRRNLELLSSSDTWYLDGTFKVSIYSTAGKF